MNGCHPFCQAARCPISKLLKALISFELLAQRLTRGNEQKAKGHRSIPFLNSMVQVVCIVDTSQIATSGGIAKWPPIVHKAIVDAVVNDSVDAQPDPDPPENWMHGGTSPEKARCDNPKDNRVKVIPLYVPTVGLMVGSVPTPSRSVHNVFVYPCRGELHGDHGD